MNRHAWGVAWFGFAILCWAVSIWYNMYNYVLSQSKRKGGDSPTGQISLFLVLWLCYEPLIFFHFINNFLSILIEETTVYEIVRGNYKCHHSLLAFDTYKIAFGPWVVIFWKIVINSSMKHVGYKFF